MSIFLYIKDTITYGYKKLLNKISNFFYKKNIKQFCSKDCNTYITTKIKSNCLDICIKDLLINKVFESFI